MRTHSNDFKNAIKEYGRQFNDTIYYNNTTYNGDHIFSVNYSVDSSLFKSVMQTLKIDTDISMNVGDTLDYGISVVGASDEIRFNNFVVNKIEDQKDKKSKLITCYDNMIKSMVDYKSFYNATTDTSFVDDKNYYLYDLSEDRYTRYKGTRTGNPQTLGLYQSSFPMTIRSYISAICNQLGLTFKNASDTFTNYNKQVTSEHYVDIDNNSMGYTFRDVLDDLAESTGSFICIDNNGQLEIKNIKEAIGKNVFKIQNITQTNNQVRYELGEPLEIGKTYTLSWENGNVTPASGHSLNDYQGCLMYEEMGATFPYQYGTHTTINIINNNSWTFTATINATHIEIYKNNVSAYSSYMDNITMENVMLEEGTSRTTYEPYYIDTINEDYFNDKNVNIGKKVGPYNTLVLSRASDSDNIYRPTILPQNPIELKISDNPILEQDNREDFIDGIYNNINGLEFYLNDFTTLGILYYEVGDKYNVSIDNTTYPCLMLSDNIKRTTGLKEIIQTNEPPQSVTDYKYSSTTDKVEISSRNASIKVDKANASIEQIVEAVGDDGEVTGASIIMAINNDESNISLNADKIKLEGYTTINGTFSINNSGTLSMTGGAIDLFADEGETPYQITNVQWYSNNGARSSYMGAGYFQAEDSNDNQVRMEVQVYPRYLKYLKGTNFDVTFELDGETGNITTIGNTTIGGNLNTSGNATVTGSITASNYNGSIWGRANDTATNNTTDTWVPVMAGGKWQHRVIPTTYNSTAPTLTGLTLNGDSGTNNVVKSGAIENQTSFESDTFKKQSFAGSTNVSGTWYNIINVRHRNGGGDGNSYGMQLRSVLTSTGSGLEYRNQAGGNWSGWYNIPMQKTLYDNATGTNGNVTLNETSDHFTYLEIFFKITNADGSYNSQKIYLPNGKSTTLSIVHNYYTNNTPYSYLFSKRISISGTTITSVRNDYTQFRGTAVNDHNTNNNIYIVRVVGYK